MIWIRPLVWVVWIGLVHSPHEPSQAGKAGAKDAEQTATLKELVTTVGKFRKAVRALDKVAAAAPEGDAMRIAKHACEKVIPAMLKLRELGDALELMVADDMWPLPTYHEMLFVR